LYWQQGVFDSIVDAFYTIFQEISTPPLQRGRYNGGVMEVFDGGNAKSPLETDISNLCAKTTIGDASKSGGAEKKSTGSL